MTQIHVDNAAVITVRGSTVTVTTETTEAAPEGKHGVRLAPSIVAVTNATNIPRTGSSNWSPPAGLPNTVSYNSDLSSASNATASENKTAENFEHAKDCLKDLIVNLEAAGGEMPPSQAP